MTLKHWVFVPALACAAAISAKGLTPRGLYNAGIKLSREVVASYPGLISSGQTQLVSDTECISIGMAYPAMLAQRDAATGRLLADSAGIVEVVHLYRARIGEMTQNMENSGYHVKDMSDPIDLWRLLEGTSLGESIPRGSVAKDRSYWEQGVRRGLYTLKCAASLEGPVSAPECFWTIDSNAVRREQEGEEIDWPVFLALTEGFVFPLSPDAQR